jgi:hypothetical protein
LLQQLLALGYGPRLVNLRVADDSLGVEHVSRALIHATLLVEDAVGLADHAVRPVIREQREGNTAQLFGPGLEAGSGVGADIQDLDVQLLEFFVVRTEPVDLVRSPAGKRKRHERDHDRPAAKTRERDLLVGVVRCERKIRRRGARLNRHASSPCGLVGRAVAEEYLHRPPAATDESGSHRPVIPL